MSIISFTENGRRLSQKLQQEMTEREIRLFSKSQNDPDEDRASFIQPVHASVNEWARVQMESGNALLFIGACGIAVRAVAPYLTDKLQDSPVLVMDERAQHVIPLLSGHIGGANELAWELARKTGAEPVITTATDLHGKFAVDLFAKRNGLFIVDKSGIAKVSSKVLAGKEITISIENGHWKSERNFSKEQRKSEACPAEESEKPGESIPEEVCLLPYPPPCPADVVVTSEERQFDTLLLLKPKEYIIGFGCKRGTEKEKIEAFILRKLNSFRIPVRQIYALASISQKQDEQGLLAWCRKKRVPFFTYTAEELLAVKGDFTESAFVKSQVGVGNVCERAALKACGLGGRLICEKCGEAGMTIAIAKREWSVAFDEK